MEFGEWASPETLERWMVDATEGLLGALDDFTDDDPRWMGPYLPIVNPPIWEIAHVAWFAEWFVLRQLHGHKPLMEDVDARYDSATVPHTTRWQLQYPDAATTRDYVRRVGDALVDVVRDDHGLDSTAYYVAYAITHHDAHTEALTYTRQTLGWPSLAGALAGEDDIPGGEILGGDLRVDGGRLLLGGSRQQPFLMDNERWAHPVHVDSFAMAATPVTLAEFAAFVDDDGYGTEVLWSPDGWQWKQAEAALAPVYWRRGDDGWEHRVLDAWHLVSDHGDHPMVHVSWWEAEAFCTWVGRRLPTEAEWEMAATTGADGVKRWQYPWGERDPLLTEAALDRRSGSTVPVSSYPEGDGPWGHRQLIGNVWEWTSSVFDPYPHFEPDAYRDNSEPWFGTRKVLRGGSWATQRRYVRSTFRNFFTADRRDVIAGFRTCAPHN